MASEKKLDKILDEFESSIKDLGVITTPNVVVYDNMPDIDSIRLTEGFRIILIHNHNITRSLDEENVALQRQIDEAKPLSLEPTQEKEEKTKKNTSKSTKSSSTKKSGSKGKSTSKKGSKSGSKKRNDNKQKWKKIEIPKTDP